MKSLLTGFMLICSFAFTTHALAITENDLGGSVQAIVDGKAIHFPALKTDIGANIQGDLATVTVTQTFANPTLVPLNATYLFPLNKDAAVHAMTMEVGDEIIQAQIHKIEEARKKFEKAKKQGKAASMLTQHRPNMFTQKIANLMPGLPIKITLVYDQTIPRVDGNYELVVPLVVGPRYQPARSGRPPKVVDNGVVAEIKKVKSHSQFNQWEIEELPSYPEVLGLTIPDTVDKDRISIRVDLQAGAAIPNIYSRTHKIHVTGDEKKKAITLAEGRTIDNRDFVLLYQLAGQETRPAFLSHRDSKDGYFSLWIEPPAQPKSKHISAREMVFVLDTSGSMSGEPIDASKAFMRHALNNLRSRDYFRIIRFSNNASEFTSGPVRATPNNINNGLNYVDSLDANGGTEIPNAIRQAFSTPKPDGTLRIVVFLTDGYIGNESEVLRLISSSIGDARIYAFGVGTSVNRFLLSEMGKKGRGFARFLDPTENGNEVAMELAGKLESPVLTDIHIDWGELQVSEVTPSVIPDLFAGDSIRVLGKIEGKGTHTVQVKGRVRGRQASLPLQAVLPTDQGEITSSPIPQIWARSQISDHMGQINAPDAFKTTSLNNDELKQKVIELGLKHSLATRWTSFVAVSRKIVNANPQNAKDSKVPLPMVKGVGPKAYGEAPPMRMAQNFSGSSVPEPPIWAGMILMFLMVAGMTALMVLKRNPSK
ncbi:MAG: VIT and VWA domain-containing protein [Nitrospinota bacterium]|nr:VIT and VWA domain-containing protein [Nitrospinota bacterium]